MGFNKKKGWNKTIKGQKIYILKRRKNKTNTHKKKKNNKTQRCLFTVYFDASEVYVGLFVITAIISVSSQLRNVVRL